MSKLSWIAPRALAASVAVLTALGSLAWAQQPPTVRIRGTIEAVDGPLLTVKSREGSEMKVRVTDNAAGFGDARIAVSEIKPGSYIGGPGMPDRRVSQERLLGDTFPENLART